MRSPASGIAAALAATLAAATLTAADPGLRLDGWRTLRMTAHKMLFFSGAIEMRVRSNEEGRRVLETRTVARFMGARLTDSQTTSVLDPETGRPLLHTSVSGKHGRIFRFDDTGYSVQKLKPADDRDAPLDRWEIRSTERFDYPADATVYDYYGMILGLHDAGLRKPGDRASFWVATSDGPKAYRVQVAEARTRERRIEDLRDGSDRSVSLRELRLRIAPEDPTEDDEGFLKMEGETELWIDARSGTLVELNGKVPKVPGRVQVVLDSIG